MSKLRKLARGKDCLVRIPGVCNFDPATTVLAHIRDAGGGGIGMKPCDLAGAWACSSCHDTLDQRRPLPPGMDVEDLAELKLEGLLRTLEAVTRLGVLK